MQSRCVKARSAVTTEQTTGAAYANVTGLVVYTPEDGIYNVSTNITTTLDGVGDATYITLTVNGNNGGTSGEYTDTYSSGTGYFSCPISSQGLLLKAGDIVSIQAKYTGSSTKIRVGSSITITKVGV